MVPDRGRARGLLAELLQVIARAEGAARAGEDDDRDLRIGVGLPERRLRVARQRPAHGVQPLGPAERHDADRPAALEDDEAHEDSRSTSRVLPSVRGSVSKGSRVTVADAPSAARIRRSSSAAASRQRSGGRPGAASARTGMRS